MIIVVSFIVLCRSLNNDIFYIYLSQEISTQPTLFHVGCRHSPYLIIYHIHEEIHCVGAAQGHILHFHCNLLCLLLSSSCIWIISSLHTKSIPNAYHMSNGPPSFYKNRRTRGIITPQGQPVFTIMQESPRSTPSALHLSTVIPHSTNIRTHQDSLCLNDNLCLPLCEKFLGAHQVSSQPMELSSSPTWEQIKTYYFQGQPALNASNDYIQGQHQ